MGGGKATLEGLVSGPPGDDGVDGAGADSALERLGSLLRRLLLLLDQSDAPHTVSQ